MSAGGERAHEGSHAGAGDDERRTHDDLAGPPLATYRLQITADFPLAAAAELVPYLRELGISHLYSSPLLQARRGSAHGYDVIDPRRIDEERGGEAGFAALCAALRAHGLGLLLDVVPNHMAASPQNPWWRDVLAHGPASRFASFFDVDWEAPGLEGKVLLPLLGEPLGDALASGHLRLEEEGDTIALAYHDIDIPLAPETIDEVRAAGLDAYAGEEGTARLDALLARQHWRLAFWRLGGEQLNYRRFFDVDDLVGVRVEEEEVFAATHARILELWRQGAVHGLRVDHVDGLREPAAYLARLRAALAPGPGRDTARSSPPYVVVEKILAAGEELREEWPCAGTTGYGMANALTGLFVDPAGLAALDRVYGGYTAQTESFVEIRYARKKQVLADLFAADQARLLRRLQPLAAADLRARDLPDAALRTALAEVTACLPVYRTYVDARGVADEDHAWLAQTFTEARRRAATRPDGMADPVTPLALDFLAQVLLLTSDDEATRAAWLRFTLDWQQSTGAVMAKGLEDTALYVHGRLLSLNAVGGEPPGVDPPGNVGAFHERNQRRAASWPHGLSATSTHDSKRSEDVGARIDLLSELPAEWEKRLQRWAEWNAPRRRRLADGREAPDRNEEVFLYQTLLGVWPLEPAQTALDEPARDALATRLCAYLRKSLREAKTHSSWLSPDAEYEDAVLGFAADLLRAADGEPFRADFHELVERVAPFGAWGSLAQVVLKATVPGVPDFYQGTELWDLSLVDPDNRRPVDFARRRAALRGLRERHAQGDREALLAELLASWRDGRVKLYTTWRGLAARRAAPDLFLDGDYVPLLAEGERARHVIAFARRRGERWAIAIVPRWLAGIVGAQQAPVGEALWAGTTVSLPDDAPARLVDAFSAATIELDGGRLAVGAALARFPVALLLAP